MDRHKKIRVWLVDDNSDYCLMLGKGLNKSRSIRCDRTFGDCDKFLQELHSVKHAPQVILLDIEMPTMSGLDIIQPILRFSPASKILMLTGHDDDHHVQRALKSGASGYLLKTSTINEIVSAVYALTQGGIPIDPIIARKIVELLDLRPHEQVDLGLTRREGEIVQLMMKGHDKDKIAEKLCLSFHTVDTHIKNIFEKLRVHSTRELMAKAMKEQLY
jgi:DNA-binding NarL/FixJ family response regulator